MDVRNVTPNEDEPAQHPDQEPQSGRWEPSGGAWGGGAWVHRGRNFPWLGILLVLIGLGLLVQAALPTYVSSGTVLLFALGLALVAAWMFGGSWLAAVPGLLLIALAVANLIAELHIYDGPGRTALSLAVAFVLIWVINLLRQRRSTWPLWAAAIMALIGGVQVSGHLTNIPELNVFWPLVIIVVGVLLLMSSRRSSAT